MKDQLKDHSQKIIRLMLGLDLVLVVYWSNLTNFIIYFAFFEYSGNPLTQMLFLFLVCLSLIWVMKWEGSKQEFFDVWKVNIPVFLFLCLAVLSLCWSVGLPFTVYQCILAICISFIGSFFGMRFSDRDLILFLSLTINILAIVSLTMILLFPKYGIHAEPIYEGLWRGIFWHKIYLGATMALGYIANLVILFGNRTRFPINRKIIAGIMLPVLALIAIKSDSASGLVVFTIQTALFILVNAWLKWGKKISRKAYWIIGTVSGFALLGFLLNIGSFFKLFNRSANLTGRVPMWEHVFTTYISKRPLFGYGFGAFWEQDGITKQVQSFVNWQYPVLVSDNGYLDITLNLGFIGLFLLLSILAVGFWRSIRHAMDGRELTGFFPFFLLMHIFLINISLSYFFENEVFIWFLLILVLFSLSPKKAAGVTPT